MESGLKQGYQSNMTHRNVGESLPMLHASPSVSSIQTARSIINLDNQTQADYKQKGSLRVDSSAMINPNNRRSGLISDYQKNLVVSNVTLDIPTQNSFSRNFKKNVSGFVNKRNSVPPQERFSKANLLSPDSNLSSQLLQNANSGPKTTRNASKMKDILKRVKPEYQQEERIPDTEHLARMRALLVKAH